MKQEDKELFKETFYAARYGLLIFFGFWTAAYFGAPLWALLLGGVVLITIVSVKEKKTLFEYCKELFWFTLLVGLVFSLHHLFGGWGLLGLLLIVLILSSYILVRRWRLYMSWIHYIEERFLYKKRDKK